LSIPGVASPGWRWLRFFEAINRESACVEDEWIGLFSIEVEHVLHAGHILGVDLRNAPHILAPWFQVIFGQAPARGLTRKADVLGEADR
jgi:hypothetical protein